MYSIGERFVLRMEGLPTEIHYTFADGYLVATNHFVHPEMAATIPRLTVVDTANTRGRYARLHSRLAMLCLSLHTAGDGSVPLSKPRRRRADGR